MLKALQLVSWLDISILENLITTDWELIQGVQKEPTEIQQNHTDGFQAIIGFNPNKEHLKQLILPKIVLSPATGIEWADVEYFQANNIQLVNNHANALSVAEHAWALILDQTRLISYNDRKVRDIGGVWTDPKIRLYPSIGLVDKKLGVLGFGAIGKEVGRIGKAFGMIIWAYKRTAPSQEDQILADRFFLPNQLEELLSESDVLVVALPKTSETIDLLNVKRLNLLKSNTILCNISRSEIINEKALYELLKAQSIHGAGLDPMYLYPYHQKEIEDPKIANFPFHELENVTISPHRAWTSDHAMYEVTKEIAYNLDLIAEKTYEKLSIVNFSREY